MIKAVARPPLDASLSLYLDLARISAATLVLLHHVFQPPFHDVLVRIPGRSAVIVFFVISGFVIAYASEEQRSWHDYAVARFARIYSVALPAVLLTGTLYAVGRHLWPEASGDPLSYPAMRMLISLAFANQFWNLTVASLTNGPYWSLCYEVWYYVVFGILLFGRGVWRTVSIAALAMLVGPRILLLMPIWLLGVLLYRTTKCSQPGQTATAGGRRPVEMFLFVLSVALFLGCLFVWNPGDALSGRIADSLIDGYWIAFGVPVFLGADSQLPSDYALAGAFALTVRMSPVLFRGVGPTRFHVMAIRNSASYTFSLYLYHAPLLVFLNLVMTDYVPQHYKAWMLLSCIIPAVWLLGNLTEHRKRPYSRFIGHLLHR